jgi:DNA ligase-1
MKLPILYSRTSTGAVQSWEIEVQGDRHRVTSGQIDGQKVVSEWTVCQAKNVGRSNETSPEDQAAFEAKSKWKKKIDSGYKEDLGKIDDIEFIEPMLAKSFEDYADDLKYPVFSQPKYDGIRCIATQGALKSRGGKPFSSVPHIAAALESLFDELPGLALDGELYCDKFANDFNRICSLVKKSKPSNEDLKESAAAIQYWVYDIASGAGRSTFSERHAFLKKILSGRPSCIRIVPTTAIHNRQQLDAAYDSYMEAGYEGQMVRLDWVYENKRSKALLKRKEFKDEEFLILDVIEGDGNKSGMAASMLLRNVAGQQFNSNIKGDREYLRGLLKSRQDLLGKLATVKYFNLTPDGIPRFPYVIAIRDYE